MKNDMKDEKHSPIVKPALWFSLFLPETDEQIPDIIVRLVPERTERPDPPWHDEGCDYDCACQ